MPSLSFEGETHEELVRQVKRWLQSVDGPGAGERISASEAVERGADLTKEALKIIASAAPGPVATSEVLQRLTEAGYKVTDQTRDTVLASLDAIEQLGGGFRREAGDRERNAVYEMNAAVAKQILRTLTGR